MYHFFVPQGPGSDGIVRITGSDVHHMRDVLRMKPAETVVVSDGSERDYYCAVVSLEEDEVVLQVQSEAAAAELPARITLYQGLPKADKMELIIQKAVELGAARVVPVTMARSVVRLDQKRAASKAERWQRIAESAAKQSGRSIIPAVGRVMSFREALTDAGESVIIVPYENENGMLGTAKVLESLRPGMDISVFIGPEGGFDPEEIEAARSAGAETVSLGRRILRTETAGLVMLTMIMMELELKNGN